MTTYMMPVEVGQCVFVVIHCTLFCFVRGREGNEWCLCAWLRVCVCVCVLSEAFVCVRAWGLSVCVCVVIRFCLCVFVVAVVVIF